MNPDEDAINDVVGALDQIRDALGRASYIMNEHYISAEGNPVVQEFWEILIEDLSRSGGIVDMVEEQLLETLNSEL